MRAFPRRISRQPQPSLHFHTSASVGPVANFFGLTGSLSCRGVLLPELGSRPVILNTIVEKLKRKHPAWAAGVLITPSLSALRVAFDPCGS
jgi:hypothetical protein